MSAIAKVTPADLAYRIEEEGIGYAVQHYYGRDIDCPGDRTLEALWKAAYDALEALDKQAKFHQQEQR